MAPEPSESTRTNDQPTAARPITVYLDQNMWIDLARAARTPADHPRAREILEQLCAKVEAGEVRLPLTASNLYETHKVESGELRASIAYTQACLSQGLVFRGRRRRLEVEIARVLKAIYDVDWREPEPDWVFSTLFFEAHGELDDPRYAFNFSDRLLAMIRSNPQAALFDHLAWLEDPMRREAVAKFEAGSERLRADIEERRARHRDESLSLRRKIYSVLLVMDDQDTMIAVADQLGLPWRCFEDNKGATMRQVVNETPTLLIEREIALKLEEQPRPIEAGDMRDMRNFTAVPYANVVVAEKVFTNFARQAGLAKRFDVRLETRLDALREVF